LEKEFVQLLNTHAGIIYKVCQLYCRTPADRQDLFQEIVLQLWKSYPTFKQEARFSTWMYRIALNTAITHYRKERRRPQAVFMEGFEMPDLAAANADNEDIRILYKAIEQLSAVEKAIILLFLDEKSYEEIAEITGITKTNVGVKLNRTKQKLDAIFKTITL
jgi:RNA polymerase sigma-70 factor (ECF subfamily)